MDKRQSALSTRMINAQIIKENDAVKIDYGLAVLKSEGIKTLLLILIFGGLGRLGPFLFLMTISIPLRLFCGGIHLKSSWGCFLMSFAVYALELMVLPKLGLPQWGMRLLLLISVIVICLAPLAPSEKRPIRSKRKYARNKALGISFCIVEASLLMFVIPSSYLGRCGIWALGVQAIQLICVYFSYKIQRRYRNV